jgi:hypothetical protein
MQAADNNTNRVSQGYKIADDIHHGDIRTGRKIIWKACKKMQEDA